MPDATSSIIEAVKTPLGFFVLVVLLVEVIFAVAGKYFAQQRRIIVGAMIILIFLLVGLVASLACFKPEALKGERYSEDPEIAKIRQVFQQKENTVNRFVGGGWTFVTSYQREGLPRVDLRGSCEIKKSRYGISINGNCLDQQGKPYGAFIVKLVFMQEDGLTYMFEMPLALGKAILGVAQVRFIEIQGESRISQMRGNWAVLGTALSGTVEFIR